MDKLHYHGFHVDMLALSSWVLGLEDPKVSQLAQETHLEMVVLDFLSEQVLVWVQELLVGGVHPLWHHTSGGAR